MLRKYIIFLYFFSILSLFSQNKEQVFLQNIEKKFDKKAYKKCIKIYESFEKEVPESPYLFEAKEFYAKSLLHTKQKDIGVEILFELFSKEYSFHFVETKH